MSKVDHKKELSQFYKPSAKYVVEVMVPTMSYLMIDGHGDPNTTPAYAEAVETLFSVSYTAKFALKRSTPSIDYAVMPLEGLWWAEDHTVFESNDRKNWKWTMMIMQPPVVTAQTVEAAIDAVGRKKTLTALSKLRFEDFREGRCAQTLHIGSFDEEAPTIQRIHDYILARGRLSGKHHEIYLSDIRRADPTRWKTIIRQPMQSAKSATKKANKAEMATARKPSDDIGS